MNDWQARKKPPLPQQGSATDFPGSGRTQATIALMSGRGVKYCPAPLLISSAFFCKRPSYISPLTSEDMDTQVSLSIICTTRYRIATLLILLTAPLNIWPRMPPCSPSFSNVALYWLSSSAPFSVFISDHV